MLICGDSLLELQKQPEASVDAVITDPPYQLSSITDRFGKKDSVPAQEGRDGAFRRVSKGFMGKEWDVLPGIDIWRECLRVLKPGGCCLVMCSPRQDSLWPMMRNLDEAGFLMGFSSLYWTYASGFPKASNIGKMVDKRVGVEFETTPASGVGFMNKDDDGWHTTKNQMNRVGERSDEAKALDGSYGGFQPKPAVEVIIVAMKPLSEKTFVGQALKNGKGVTWMDDCRIPYEGVDDKASCLQTRNNAEVKEWKGGKSFTHKAQSIASSPQGRFPANLLVSDDVLEAAETTPSGAYKPPSTRVREQYFEGRGMMKASSTAPDNYGDGGSFSRYFDLDAWDKAARDTFPFLIVPKPAKSEKLKGCASVEGEVRFSSQNESGKMLPTAVNEPHLVTGNFHPTVKPLKLMRYLITLTTREGDTVLDPFVGSGTTCVAAKQLNREYIGIDIEEDYIKIATARVSAAWRQPSLDSFAHPAIKEAADG